MIHAEKEIIKLEGEPKELCVELTYLLSSFKDTMIKEFKVSEEDISKIILECCNIAFMNNIERKKYLDNLVQDYKNKY